MEKIFVTEVSGLGKQYFYCGEQVSRETVVCIGYQSDLGWSTHSRTDEELLKVPGVTVKEVGYRQLTTIFDAVYSGPPREEFVKEEGGLAYFTRSFGDRPAGINWRIPVLETFGDMVVLDHLHAESRRFSQSNFRLENGRWECDCKYSEWANTPLQAGFQFG